MLIAVDTETTGLDLFHNAEPFLVSTMDEEGLYRYWEWEVDPFTRKVHPSVGDLHEIADYFDGNELVFHHATFDLRALSRVGFDWHIGSWTIPFQRDRQKVTRVFPKLIHDTQLLSHVCNSQGAGKGNDYGMHGLKPLGLHYLDIPENDQKELHKATVAARRIGKKLGWKLGVPRGKGDSGVLMDYWMPRALWVQYQVARNANDNAKFWNHNHVPDEWKSICSKYAIGDVHRTIGLYFFLQEILQRDGLQKQYERELRLLPVTYNMEHVGMHLHKEQLADTLQDFEQRAIDGKQKAEKIFCNLTGQKEINVNSAPQLTEALDICNLRIAARTKTGLASTEAKHLRNLAQYCEAHEDNLVYTGVSIALRHMIGWNPDVPEYPDDCEEAVPGYKTYKTGTAYCTGYYRLMDGWSCVHPSYNQVGTSWTRYSCSEPNGQNVSKKAILPLRRIFGPPAGYVWLAVDYAQLELRIFAYASEDQGLIRAFESGLDFHSQTACEMFGVTPDQVTSEMRRYAKNVNFGIVYGAGPRKIDQQTGKPGTYDLYMSKFPNARDYMRKVIDGVESCGFTHTLGGYRLYVPEDKAYAGVNAVIQGTAGEIVKNAMVDIHEKNLVDWEEPTEELLYGGSSIVANIHDELVFQFPKTYPYRSIGRRICACMEQAGEALGVVTPCDAKLIYTNWAEGEKFAA